MFDDAKYMAKEAVDRNNAIGALSQQRDDPKVYRWSLNQPLRRLIASMLALVIVAYPLVTAENEPLLFVGYSLAWLLLFGLARTAMRGNAQGSVSRADILVLTALSAISVLVAMSAQTDINKQAGVTATAGVLIAIVTASIGTHTITRCWR